MTTFAAIDSTLTWLTAWRRAMQAIADAKSPEEREGALATAQRMYADWDPAKARKDLEQASAAHDSKATPRAIASAHVQRLGIALGTAGASWPDGAKPTDPADHAARAKPDAASLTRAATSTIDALERAMQHALFCTYVQQLLAARPGERVDFSDAMEGWHLAQTQIETVWTWVRHDTATAQVDGNDCVPLLVDNETRSAYRTPSTLWQKLYTQFTVLWAGALGLGAIIGVFALLNRAGLTSWPPDWGWKLLVLYLFVLGGAMLHVASLSLGRIRFDDPLRVYAAATGVTWLRLRWIAILRLYIPIVFVAGCLWGAGNIPASFQDLGTAILAGYSADSLFRASLARVQEQAGNRAAETGGNDKGAQTPMTPDTSSQ